MDNPPSILYKYFPPERIDAFLGSNLRFSPLSAFNDPFEGQPVITGLVSEGTLKKSILDGLPAALQDEYNKIPEQNRKKLSVEQFVAMTMSGSTDVVIELLNQITPVITSLAKSVPGRLNEHVGALCLTESPDNILMWSHYGASHTGFVIGFDAGNDYFHSPRSGSDEFTRLRRVSYSAARPSGALIDLGSPELFFMKSERWGYENEWRTLKPLKDAPSVINSPSGDIHLFTYPRTAIKSITFGARSTEALRMALRSELEAKQEYQRIELYEAIADQTSYSIKLSRVPL